MTFQSHVAEFCKASGHLCHVWLKSVNPWLSYKPFKCWQKKEELESVESRYTAKESAIMVSKVMCWSNCVHSKFGLIISIVVMLVTRRNKINKRKIYMRSQCCSSGLIYVSNMYKFYSVAKILLWIFSKFWQIWPSDPLNDLRSGWFFFMY